MRGLLVVAVALACIGCHDKITRCNELQVRLPRATVDAGIEVARDCIRQTHEALTHNPTKDPALEAIRNDYIKLCERADVGASELADAGVEGGKLALRVKAVRALDTVASDEKAMVERLNTYCSEK